MEDYSINKNMEIRYFNLERLVGKSFAIMEDYIIDIYMFFVAEPYPFFLIKERSKNKILQVSVLELASILKSVNPPLYEIISEEID